MRMDKIDQFRSLFECHFTPLVKYSYYFTRDKEQSKDIVQNFFIDIWKNNELDGIRSFESFAFFSIRNKSLTYLRDSKNLVLSVPDFAAEDHNNIYDSHFPEYLLEAAIQRLPEKCRAVFVLSKLEGLTYHEIAERQNLSIKTVEKHIGTGLRKLKDMLLPYKQAFLENNI
jgi:RNA polymerase sigma-70 factor (ECF subfamily)